ncbi:iron ABC transporter permease [Notoacmeibacter sp. MSK16QG-6]|uniref:ABC transporter permease n=1 Tax=Notoacmeibacter sp. MSK16QG-6 TaxID=2957982 RepID=UPI00209E8045|nr:iron ABC transporter permease [Notoacmeibacter sp. MSK16QG-6]MCP1198543.1 iron ABC transporter permease [Notoacmeibacter sp. MSK16QG-6]
MEALLSEWRLRIQPRRSQTIRITSKRPLFAVGIIAALALLPIVTVIGIALLGETDPAQWRHLTQAVLPNALGTTLWLLLLVGFGTTVIGVGTAWLIATYEFPGRRFFAWMLVLPIAVPPYLAAYAFAEFLTYTGPVQGALRAVFGWQSARDYWFPDIRSTPGAALVMGVVLYPYLYLAARVIFLMQGRNIADVARTLGAGTGKVFGRVMLPTARPAIVAGLALVMMETLNDIGAVEHLGVRTLTFAIYDTWLSRGSLAGAAQLAAVMMTIIFSLVLAENWARRRQIFHGSRATQMMSRPVRQLPSFGPKLAMSAACALPILFGFGIPVAVLGRYAFNRSEQFTSPALMDALGNSILLGAVVAAVTVMLAFTMLAAGRLERSRLLGSLSRLSTLGYAMPGTILGLGLLFALTTFDNSLDRFLRANFNISTGLLLSGSAIAVGYACTARFLALADANLRAGMQKLPPHIDHAARSLGAGSGRSLFKILLPLLKPALGTAYILVFVDTVKELSATILLRPFGFNTLATHVYENASRGAVEDGAAAAILILFLAMIPVLLLSYSLRRDKPV